MYKAFILFLLIPVISCKFKKQQNSISSSKFDKNIDLLFDIDSLLLNIKHDTIHIPYDWETKKENKYYRGVSTNLLFNKIISKHNIDTSTMEVIFLCKDGYSASVPFYQLLNHKGYLTNKDIEAESQWEEGFNELFSPYYLVWNLKKDDHNHNFPYGITQIKISNSKTEYLDAQPLDGSDNVLKGFNIYKKKCIKCHSINLAGGNVGPELNIPMNITEYWDKNHLEKFILNPSKYRYNSKMPAMTELNKEDSKLVVEYLSYMAKNKRQ